METPTQATTSCESRRRAILVLGMHRTGTSALTRMLSLLGADLPLHLMPATDANNPKGFWESARLKLFHDALLASANSGWDDWRALDADWLRSPLAPVFAERARALVAQEFGGAPLFVLKDPRICRFLPFWLDVLSATDIDVGCVLPLRNPLEVADSLHRRDGFAPAKSYLLWMRHVLDAEADSRRLPRVLLTFDDLLMDWRGAAQAIAATLRLPWPPDPSTAAAIDAFLEAPMRHHRRCTEELLRDRQAPEAVKAVYETLLTVTREGVSAPAIARLDTLRRDFAQQTTALAALLAERSAQGQRGKSVGHAAPHRIGAASLDVRLPAGEAIPAPAAETARHPQSRQPRAADLDALIPCSAARNERAVDEADLAHHVQTLAAQLAHEQGEVAALRADREALVRQRERLLEHLEDLHRSAAWTLTRPLRLLERLSPGLLKGAAGLPSVLWWMLTLRLRRQLAERRLSADLLRSGLFDAHWYGTQCPDAVLGEMPSVRHWLIHGHLRGYDPHPLFDVAWYRRQLRDDSSGCDPLSHYLAQGAARRIDPHPLFDTSWYLAQLTADERPDPTPLQHYLAIGWKRGLDPHPVFSTGWYLDRHPDIAGARINPLIHFVREGWRERREPSPWFDLGWYLDRNPDVRERGLNPLLHYLREGGLQGLDPTPTFCSERYLADHPLLREQSINPLVHALRHAGTAAGAASHRLST